MRTKIFDPDARYEPVALPTQPHIPEQTMIAKARDFYHSMQSRHSIRDFSDRPVPREVIEYCIRTAGGAPNGANHQPWHFCAISAPAIKQQIRAAAENEEREFYRASASEEWLTALTPLGTDPNKPFLEIAPWLIVIFAERYGIDADSGKHYKNYYINESVGIATGFLIAALHQAGLGTLTHTPNPMKFLNAICKRPANEKPYMILVSGYPAEHVTIPKKATRKKTLDEIADFI